MFSNVGLMSPWVGFRSRTSSAKNSCLPTTRTASPSKLTPSHVTPLPCARLWHSSALVISLASRITWGRGRSMTFGGMMGKKAYSRRYFALSGTTISYYREIESETPAGAIKLEVRRQYSVGPRLGRARVRRGNSTLTPAAFLLVGCCELRRCWTSKSP
jgi:hypothetical protein